MSVQVGLTLTVTPGTVTPALTGKPDFEVAFDDADSSWYDVWANQAGNGSAFSVARAGGTTTVRLGAIRVSLDAVSLPSCQSRAGTGAVSGTFSDTLSMDAVMMDGAGVVVLTTKGSCSNPPPP